MNMISYVCCGPSRVDDGVPQGCIVMRVSRSCSCMITHYLHPFCRVYTTLKGWPGREAGNSGVLGAVIMRPLPSVATCTESFILVQGSL